MIISRARSETPSQIGVEFLRRREAEPELRRALPDPSSEHAAVPARLRSHARVQGSEPPGTHYRACAQVCQQQPLATGARLVAKLEPDAARPTPALAVPRDRRHTAFSQRAGLKQHLGESLDVRLLGLDDAAR
jgi:hypothetical protein